MIAGHLQEKKGYYYAVLSYKGADNKRKTKWLSTGLTVKGNKKRAEAFLMEQRQHFVIPAADAPVPTGDELFADYLRRWLQIARTTIAESTYGSYSGLLRNPIEPWFRRKRITLKGLTAADIQAFYMEQSKRVKANMVIHYHAVLHRSLRYAVKTDLIPVNPADKVDRPRKSAYQASFYSEDELHALFAAVTGTHIEVPVKLAAFYGLRRSEVMGLRWDAIDFAQGTLTIRHTVTGCSIDGKYTIIAADTTKTRSSRRTLPLVPPVRDMLLRLKAQQEQSKRLCGRSYSRADEGYVCLNELGERICPAYLSRSFSRILAQNSLRHIRFHDLRHSSATL
ncbi:MAG TPA: site-specific integrase, partial [Candidatus Limiplasma pullicola]|nr:site-specific integrase [Candidatus Limiplasma pullicola]